MKDIRNQKGFTLIELMVVIVIIGILSALAIPRMFGVSSKAKAAEAPTVLSNWETLQGAYDQETGQVGAFTDIGFIPPTSKWFDYSVDPMAGGPGPGPAAYAGTVTLTFGDCIAGEAWTTEYTVGVGAAHTPPATATCAAYTPNF